MAYTVEPVELYLILSLFCVLRHLLDPCISILALVQFVVRLYIRNHILAAINTTSEYHLVSLHLRLSRVCIVPQRTYDEGRRIRILLAGSVFVQHELNYADESADMLLHEQSKDILVRVIPGMR